MHATIYRGDDAQLTIPASSVTDQDSVMWTAKASLGDADDDAVLFASDYAGTATINEGTSVVVEIAGADTEGFTQRTRLNWDLQVFTSAGKVSTIATGTLDVLMDVTQTVASS
jgi:hypothetical protein